MIIISENKKTNFKNDDLIILDKGGSFKNLCQLLDGGYFGVDENKQTNIDINKKERGDNY